MLCALSLLCVGSNLWIVFVFYDPVCGFLSKVSIVPAQCTAKSRTHSGQRIKFKKFCVNYRTSSRFVVWMERCLRAAKRIKFAVKATILAFNISRLCSACATRFGGGGANFVATSFSLKFRPRRPREDCLFGGGR